MVVLGRVIAPFGVQGWLKLVALGDDPAAWRAMPAWWLGKDPDGKPAWFVANPDQPGKYLRLDA